MKCLLDENLNIMQQVALACSDGCGCDREAERKKMWP